jgi:hypothetical protein
LARHRDPLKPEDFRKFAAADVAARPSKGNRAWRVFHSFTVSLRIATIETFF